MSKVRVFIWVPMQWLFVALSRLIQHNAVIRFVAEFAMLKFAEGMLRGSPSSGELTSAKDASASLCLLASRSFAPLGARVASTNFRPGACMGAPQQCLHC